ncbi:MAG: BTAD domain-containing putative transcriptional regulator [Ilumatobacteraceae bacterium]
MISVLGRTRVGDADLVSGRQRSLLAALVLHRGAPVSVARLATLVWGDEQPADAGASLHTLVFRLRRELPEGVTVDATAGHYSLSVPAGDVDVDAVLAWRTTTDAATPAERVPTFEALLRLFRGEPYADLDDLDVLAVKEQLGEVRLAVLEGYADALMAAGRTDDAISALRTVLVERPDRESAVTRLMQALYAAGRQLDALAAASRLREYLREEFGVDPSPAIEAAELAILRHEVPDHAVATPVAPLRTMLPRQISSFIGRDHDLDGLLALTRRARCITVLGAGGIGKTTLAVHVAEELHRTGWHVHVVELGDIEAGADIVSAVVGRVGAVPGDDGSLEAALIRHFGGPQTALVLDNCEHVLDEAAHVATALLAGTEHLRVVATSREPLRVSGEHRWMLHPLDPADARELFVERALAVDPGFESGSDDARVIRLCEQLDGLPLALELAASALSTLAIDDVLDQVADRFTLLAANHRDAPSRQQSMVATLDWSYSRLETAEQQAFDRLGVFAGSFTAADARDVAGERSAQLLPQLVERSLVGRVRGATPVRYEFLDTMRAFARLQRGAALADDRAHHAAWMLRSVTEAAAHVSGPMESMWFRWFRANMANLRQAHQWFVEAGADDDRIRFVRALIMWAWQSDQAEVMGWAAALDGTTHTADLDLASAKAAISLVARSRTAAARVPDAAQVVAAAEDGEHRTAALAHYAAAEVGLFVGDYQFAEEHARRACVRATAGSDDAESIAIAFFAAIDVSFATALSARPEEASRWVTVAEQYANTLDSTAAHAWVNLVRADLLARDHPVRSRIHAQRCLALVDPEEQSFVARVARLTLSAIELHSGTAAVDRATLVEHLSASELQLSWYDTTISLQLTAETLIGHGRLREAAMIIGAVNASAIDPAALGVRGDDLMAAMRARDGGDMVDAACADGATWTLAEAVHFAIDQLQQLPAGPT